MDIGRVAIIGVDCISTSIALGLKAQTDPPEIVGYAADAAAATLARRKGAFDRLERRPGQACQGADLVVVSVPLPAIRETFTAIAPRLKPGCLVTDTACLKTPVVRWAEEFLPDNVFFVGGRLIPNPAIVGSRSLADLETASADLLREALYCFTTSTTTAGGAIDVFAGLARTLGTYPFFIDVTEHDGLQAGVEGLPDVLAIALLRATVDTPGWQEMRKFAGRRFAHATVAADDADERCAAIFLNRKHLLPRLDALLDELVGLRDLLSQGDAEALEEVFVTTAAGRARWLDECQEGMWIRERAIDTDLVPTAGGHLRQLLFGDIDVRRKGRASDSRGK
jgi:prephenate dehydrogenase